MKQSFCTSADSLAGMLGLVGWQIFKAGPGDLDATSSSPAKSAAAPPPPPPPPPREDAVLVLGATGRVGRRVVQKVRDKPPVPHFHSLLPQ